MEKQISIYIYLTFKFLYTTNFTDRIHMKIEIHDTQHHILSN